jgi:two-component system, cell cycle response regulator
LNLKNDELEKRELARKEAFIQLSADFTLPSPSSTVIELMKLCNSESSSLNEIADLIQADPALSAELIKYANSSLMATGVQVASVHNATIRLGIKNVVNLLLGFSMLTNNRGGSCKNFDYPLFWRTCLAQALAAYEIAKLNKDFNPDELYVCGLLSQIGKLSLATIFPKEYEKILVDQPPNTPMNLDELEKFGIDSAELTTELFLSWGMPANYALAAGFHEDYANLVLGSGQTQRLAVVLYIASNIAKMCQSDEPLFEILELIVNTADKYDIDMGFFAETFQVIVNSWHEHGEMLEIETSECYVYTS